MNRRHSLLVPAAALILAFAAFTACAPRAERAGHAHAVGDNCAVRLALQLETDLRRVRQEAEQLATQIAGLYARRDELAARADPSAYAFAPNGAYHKITNDGGPALWISAAEPITESVIQVAHFTEALDPVFIEICRRLPEVGQIYYNDRHSLNRIYPWFDTIAQYPPRMVIPEFNFYYLADAAHNPARRGVWVDEPYVDPAGRGWMVSALAPVYVDEVLEGVPGLDVTIAAIVERYLLEDDRALAVISRQGVLVAATELAIEQLEMPPIRDHKYLETVKLDTFKPDEYNVLKSTLRPVRALALEILGRERGTARVELKGELRTALYARVPELGWTVVEFVPR